MEGISLDFHCFKALNNNLEARLFLHVHFYASDLLMACRTMQLRFLKLGTVLNYAFNQFKKKNHSDFVVFVTPESLPAGCHNGLFTDTHRCVMWSRGLCRSGTTGKKEEASN